jgi:hypothetical protein
MVRPRARSATHRSHVWQRGLASHDGTFPAMNQLIDAMLAWPSPVVVLFVTGVWALIAFVIHRFVVPLICGADGRKLGRFEAEVTSQVALAFGLLISFNAVWLWDRNERVQGAVVDEAAALSSIIDEADDLPPEQRAVLREGVEDYARYLVDIEWPTLAESATDRNRPPQLVALRSAVRATGVDELKELWKAADDARDLRVRDGLRFMTPPRWGVVVILATLLLVSIGALHGESHRGRVVAMTLVTIAISACFGVIVIQARPFVGAFRIEPTELREVLGRLDGDSSRS